MGIKIGHLSTVYHTALIMQGLDLLKKKGVEAKWELFGGGPAIVEAMRRGTVDIGYIGLPPAMIGLSKGAKIRCVAGGHVEGTTLCTRHMAGRTVENSVEVVMNGLEGEKVGSPPKGSIHDTILRYLIKKNGVRADVINYPWADFIPLAMEKREIGAAIGTPALAIFLKRELDAEITCLTEKIWPFNPSYGIISRDDFLDSEELRVFIETHEETNNQIINSPRRSAETAANTLGFIDSGFALEVMKLSSHYCAALPQEYIDSTMRFVPVMLELGYISRKLTVDEIFHTEIIDGLHPDGHHYNQPLKH